MSLDIITRGIIEFYATALFFGFSTGVLVIVFGIMFQPRKGEAFYLPRGLRR